MAQREEDLFNENYLKGYEYEILMNALHVSVFKCLLNEDFTAIWCNNYFFDSTGYTKEEYIELYKFSIRQYFSSMIDEYNQIAVNVMEAFQQGRPGFECVSRMPQKGGSFMWIKVVGTFTNEVRDGVPVLYVVYTDVTDVIEQQELRKRLEERSEMLRIALDTAEEANRAKSDFLSRMSHDIRTPLNAIIGMTEIADSHLDNPEKMHDCHRKIALSSQHLLGLINDVLDMSKIESGKMTLSNNPVFLPELFENIVAIIYPEFNRKQQHFLVHSHHIIPEAVCSDALRLRQIFLNILSNATKFTPEGGTITFDIEELPSSEPGISLIRFSISDTGIGMNPEFLDHIFDAFTREQDSRVDKTVGSGLGMAITKKIVELLDGEITVSSLPGSGTNFQVTLPLKTLDIPADHTALINLKVLFFDEDPIVCEYVASIFKTIGIEGECVSDAASVRTRLTGEETKDGYDVVILDWEMPGAGGLQMVREIGKIYGKDAPLLLATTYHPSDIEDEARDAGVLGFLSKPIFSSTLCNGLRRCLMREEHPVPEKGQENTFDFSGRRFLLAEDNELNREIAIELLSVTGASIDWVPDGAQCVEMFRQSPEGYYALILMDIQMPVMNGYTATQTIRRLPRADAKAVQIWAMTADAFVEDIETAKKVGMNGHFSKPLDITLINREISRFL